MHCMKQHFALLCIPATDDKKKNPIRTRTCGDAGILGRFALSRFTAFARLVSLRVSHVCTVQEVKYDSTILLLQQQHKLDFFLAC